MALWKTYLVIGLCLVVYAALASAANKQDSESGADSASGSEAGPAPPPPSKSSKSSKSGASALAVSSPLLAAASLFGAALYLPFSRRASQ